MKYQKTITSTACILLGLGGVFAQNSVNTTGSEVKGTGGTVNYTVGQVAYTTIIGSNGSIAQGVQQSYEFSITVGLEETSINLELSVYPNPTANYLTLKVEETENLSYQLFDMQGKLIENKTVMDNSTILSMETLPTSSYFLKVSKNNNIIKTFKIIKN
jgi:hypothetical protein